MFVYITGASGLVGRELMTRLGAERHSGVAVSRWPARTSAREWLWRERAQVLRAKSQIVPDIVIHLEVKQHVRNPRPEDLLELQNVNVHGTEEWLAWASNQGVKRFMFFSSIKAVGGARARQDEASHSTAPDTPYGESKLAAEEKVRAWAAESPDRTALILRPAVVYGPGNQANMYSFVDAIQRRRFFLVGRNDNVKSLISLKNLVAAVCHLLELPLRGTELFYLTDKESYTVAHLAETIQRILGRKSALPSLPVPVAKCAAKFGDAFHALTGRDFPISTNRLNALLENTHFSSEKLQRTGFVHPQTTREGLEEMVSWYLGNRRETAHSSEASRMS